MAFSSYPQSTDAVIGGNDLVYDNTWDNVNQDIQEAFAVEHDPSTGEHTAFDYSDGGLLVTETGTFTGDGNDDRTITLTNTNLKILFLRIWNSTQTVTVVRTTAWDTDEARPLLYTTSIANTIQALGTGSFEVGSSDYVNKNGDTIYYTAYGISTASPTGNGNSFTPSWVQHNDRIILDANSDGCPTRASKEIKSRFLHEHPETGIHDSDDLYDSGSAWIAVGSYTGTGVSGLEITVTPSFAIKALWIWRFAASYPCFKTASMPSDQTKIMLNQGLYTTYITSLGTGSFIVGSNTDVNQGSQTYYYVAFGT